MSEEDERQQLIKGEESSVPYGSKDSDPSPAVEPPAEKETASGRPSNSCLAWLYDHRGSIPGYGMLKLMRGSSIYSMYVLFVLLKVHLLNQLDRYTLSIVTSDAGYDLKYGSLTCMKNRRISQDIFDDFNITDNITAICSNCAYFDEFLNMTVDVKDNQTYCETLDVLLFYNESEYNTTEYHVCEFSYSGSGLAYQIVAGPVYNNLYPLAGLFTGFLADYGQRKIWLTVSLILWSAVTGMIGFAKTFWHLVVLRALLAIGAAGCNPFAVSLIGDYFSTEVRGTAISIYYFGIYIGYSMAFTIGNGIEQVLNWRWVFFISALAGFVVAPFVLFTVKEKNPLADKASEQKRLPLSKRVLALLKTFLMPGMLTLCIAGGIRKAGGYVWAYNAELFFLNSGYTHDHIQSFMSWIPLVAGPIGAIAGGIISDVLVKGRGPYMRIWVLIISQILAAPFAAGALFLPNPWCFLSLIPSNVIGEMWIGVTTAVVVDLAPSKIRTASIAVYIFIITIIGGNFNLLVDPLQKGFQNVHLSDLASYRWSLLFTYPGVYALSSLIFLLAFFLMRLDFKHKERVETMLVSEGTPEPQTDSSEEEVGDAVKSDSSLL